MHTLMRLFLLALAGLLAACASQGSIAPALPEPARAPVAILVSIDGFRADYLARGATPTLAQLAAEGASAAMRPSFPSKTFPNHWAIATGVRPDRSGIVANRMEDPRRPGEVFAMTEADPFWWNAAEPIWVTAERSGIRTATMFWPGSNVAWGENSETGAAGIRPSDWHQFNEAVSNRQRVDAILDWLRRPEPTRPGFLMLYFDTVDTAGHEYGPDSPDTRDALAEVDRHIAALLAGLDRLGQPANLVIVGDHGMAATSPDRAIVLDTVADPTSYRIIESGAFATLEAVPGREADLAAALLRPHAHMACWRKADVPERFHYGSHPRVASFFCLAETGWLVVPAKDVADIAAGGNHGYDNAAPEMATLFIAHGPRFRSGAQLRSFDNVDVNPLLRRLLDLPQTSAIDGSLGSVLPAFASGE